MCPKNTILRRLGLSQSEAAEALGVRPDTLKAWCRGRRNVPASIWPEITALAQRRGAAALAVAREIESL